MVIGEIILEEEVILEELALDVLTEEPELEDLTATPSKEKQEYVSQKYYGYNKVTVEPIGSEYIIPSGQKEILANGEYDVTEFAEVKVDVPEAKLGTKIITQNGTYKASDDGLDGYNVVEVLTSGVDINDYFNATIKSGTYTNPSWKQNIKKWRSPLILEGTSCSYMFREFPFDETVLPEIDVSNVTSFFQMFYGAKYIREIPWVKDGKAETMASMFQGCNALQKVNLLNGEFVTNVSSMFDDCQNLIDVEGIENLGKAYLTTASANFLYYTLGFNYSGHLTEQSIINVLNNLYDIKTKGCNVQKIILGSTNLAKLTSEEGQAALTQAQNYGWTVA